MNKLLSTNISVGKKLWASVTIGLLGVILALLLTSSHASLPLPSTFTVSAATASNYTNTGAPTATTKGSATNVLALDFVAPDAWNNSGAFTADILQKNGSGNFWQGDTLHAFTNAGTPGGVGYDNTGTGAGFQGTEPVIIDLDGDAAYTSGPDTVLDTDGSASTGPGSTTNGIGSFAAISAGAALKAFGPNNIAAGNFAFCTNSLTAPTAVRIDTNTNCADGAQNEGTYILGTSATTAGTLATNAWAFSDTGATGNKYDDGEDIFIENVANQKTFSASADTDVYATGGIVGNPNLTNFGGDCDGGGGGGPGTKACKFTGADTTIDSADDIYIDEGTKGGAAANGVVDRRDDQIVGLGFQNAGTAVNGTDIAAVKAWAENGATSGFQASEDTLLGTMTVNSGNNKEWRLGSLTSTLPNSGLRIYVTANITTSPTNGNTLKFQIPALNDVGADKAVTQDNDRGFFVASNNSGPTDLVILNANTQTIDGLTPTLTSVSVSSNNSTTTRAKAGDSVTVSFIASETITTPVVAFTSGGVAVANTATITNTSGNTWTASYNVAANDTSGAVAFTINFSDSAGNAGAQVNATTDATAVTMDNTTPSVTIVQKIDQPDPATTSPINFTVTFSESVDDFIGTDVTLSGTAGATAATATGAGTTYNVAVSGMVRDGTVIVSLDANIAHDSAGNGNAISTSTDDAVRFGATGGELLFITRPAPSTNPTPTSTTKSPTTEESIPFPASAPFEQRLLSAPQAKQDIDEGKLLVSGDVQQLLNLLGIFVRDQAAEVKFQSKVRSVLGQVSDATQEQAYINFVTYGSTSTIRIDSGERLGVLNSYKTTFSRPPTNESEWTDVLNIANGNLPSRHSAESEAAAKKIFSFVYKRSVKENSANDKNAIEMIAYGIRPSRRSLDAERVSIGHFQKLYKRIPESARDWDTIRAITYSGSK